MPPRMVDPLEDVALRKADRPTTAACATWVSAALVALRPGAPAGPVPLLMGGHGSASKRLLAELGELAESA